jgi:UDP-glucose 4-epimerase
MRVLITGSSGQIGTNLALRLVDDGHEVVGIDERSNAWTDRFPSFILDLSVPYIAHEKGIGDAEFARPEIVVHLAAHAKVHELIGNPRRAMENVIIGGNVAEYCRLTDTPMLFSSSREVYGDIHRFCTNEVSADFAYTESTYSASKIANEALIYSYARCYGLKYLVFRLSNVYGRFDNDLERMERVIPLFIHRVNRGEAITVFGKDKILDFTYIDDCVDGLYRGIKGLVGGTTVNETVNLGTGEGNSLIHMAELVADALGKPANITTLPQRTGEVNRYVADISRASRLLGYKPTVTLQQGIERCIKWNRDWEQRHVDRPHAATAMEFQGATK